MDSRETAEDLQQRLDFALEQVASTTKKLNTLHVLVEEAEFRFCQLQDELESLRQAPVVSLNGFDSLKKELGGVRDMIQDKRGQIFNLNRIKYRLTLSTVPRLAEALDALRGRVLDFRRTP